MKRSIPVFLLLVLACIPFAAPSAHAGMALGVKGGLSLSQVQADLLDTDNRTGFVGGVYASFDLARYVAIQPELLFVRKGAKLFSTDVTIGGVHVGELGSTLDVDYFEVPVLLRLSLPTPDPLGLRLLAGPVVSVKSSEKLSTTGLLQTELGTDLIKTTDFGLALGGAMAVRLENLLVVGEGRYTFGVTNISDLPFGGDVKNGTIYAMLGLEFAFGAR